MPTPVVYYRTIIFAYAGVTLRDMLISVQLRIQKIIARGGGRRRSGAVPQRGCKEQRTEGLGSKAPPRRWSINAFCVGPNGKSVFMNTTM